ncbi:UNKNOWN [Stylonychia lemnae]|uniref:Uncharacterized protein n=1 Tax=Stylonychia lemnae TaxID=5949 RepID=A0A078AIM3_STYLE|nr:UNKNOWN [Stylonychia lemnae]|eukprot:CDW82110.1 UNKNOWN [Stylonychia lemnae]
MSKNLNLAVKIAVVLISFFCFSQASIVKEYSSYNELYILQNTRISFEEFKEFMIKNLGGQVDEPIDRSVLRQQLAYYLKQQLVRFFEFIIISQKIQGFNQDPNQFDQNTEDIVLFLSHKAAKDFIMKQNLQQFSWSQVNKLMFEVNEVNQDKIYRKPQTLHSNKLLDYTNSIVIEMSNFIIDKILEHKLSWDSTVFNLATQRETIQMISDQAGIEIMSYFLFKLIYDDNRRYAYERIEQFDNFDEYLPISKY